MKHSLQFACILVSFLCFSPNVGIQWVNAQEAAPPGPDETLIYIYQEKKFGAGTMWVAVNDKTVARVKKKQYAAVRVPAGRITLNVAKQGMVMGAIAVDDRAGETVYLKWRLGDEISELDEAAGREIIAGAKQTKPIDEALANNEEIRALLDLTRLGFPMMQPRSQQLEPDNNHAILTIFRTKEAKNVASVGVWGDDGFLGSLGINEGLDVALTPGEHYLVTGHVGTTLMRAQVEAGKRYYARVDFGNFVLRVKFLPIPPAESDKLHDWLQSVSMMELVPDSATPRIRERESVVGNFVKTQVDIARRGERDFTELTSEHAW